GRDRRRPERRGRQAVPHRPGRRRLADPPAVTALRYGSDAEPGIRRRGTKRFAYVNERTGRPASRADVERITALAIPPAWTDVWIAAAPTSHVQATGRDAKGRKQYRYHPDHTSSRSADKFADLVPFAHALGRVRNRVRRDLRSEEHTSELQSRENLVCRL